MKRLTHVTYTLVPEDPKPELHSWHYNITIDTTKEQRDATRAEVHRYLVLGNADYFDVLTVLGGTDEHLSWRWSALEKVPTENAGAMYAHIRKKMEEKLKDLDDMLVYLRKS